MAGVFSCDPVFGCFRKALPFLKNDSSVQIVPVSEAGGFHKFQLIVIPSPYLCNVCLQPAFSKINVCKYCQSVCHDRCLIDLKVLGPCLSSKNKFKLQPLKSLSEYTSANMKENDIPVRLNITYITERIIAMVFPSEGQETTYKSNLTEVSQVLKSKHEDNYLMVNLSERRNDMHRLHKQVIDFGWPEALAPPLERLCNICKSVDSWLNRGRKNVVVIHCKGGMGRLAVVLSAYIDYHNICSNEDQSLDQLSMKQFFETKLCGVIQPSQKRYVHYFAGLLSGAITINNNALFLHQIVIRGIPNFDGKGGCQPYIKIYQGMKPVYMSGVL